MALAALLVLALQVTLITTVEGQGGDPRNPKPSSPPNNTSPATKPVTSKKPTKADVVKARLIELFNLCKSGRYSKVTSYVGPNAVDSTCAHIKEKTSNGYYFGKFMTKTDGDGEVLAWEVYYRGVAEKKGENWFFRPLNGKYVLVDIDPIRESPE